MALVEGLVDATLDLHQCTIGRDIGEADGYFDACFPPQAAGRAAGKAACFRKGEGLTSKARIYNYPAPGHERWSCSDPSTMEQLAAAQVLDYIISHGDRLYRERTKIYSSFGMNDLSSLFRSITTRMSWIFLTRRENIRIGRGRKYCWNTTCPLSSKMKSKR